MIGRHSPIAIQACKILLLDPPYLAKIYCSRRGMGLDLTGYDQLFSVADNRAAVSVG